MICRRSLRALVMRIWCRGAGLFRRAGRGDPPSRARLGAPASASVSEDSWTATYYPRCPRRPSRRAGLRHRGRRNRIHRSPLRRAHPPRSGRPGTSWLVARPRTTHWACSRPPVPTRSARTDFLSQPTGCVRELDRRDQQSNPGVLDDVLHLGPADVARHQDGAAGGSTVLQLHMTWLFAPSVAAPWAALPSLEPGHSSGGRSAPQIGGRAGRRSVPSSRRRGRSAYRASGTCACRHGAPGHRARCHRGPRSPRAPCPEFAENALRAFRR